MTIMAHTIMYFPKREYVAPEIVAEPIEGDLTLLVDSGKGGSIDVNDNKGGGSHEFEADAIHFGLEELQETDKEDEF